MRHIQLFTLAILVTLLVGCSHSLFEHTAMAPGDATIVSDTNDMAHHDQHDFRADAHDAFASNDTQEFISNDSNTAQVANDACQHNPYLEKYDCSIDRVEVAAQAGNPDAQYALGYMYYYGINTVQDVPTARLWIKRAASQDQLLAQKALRIVDSGGELHALHAQSGLAQLDADSSANVKRPSNIDDMNVKTAKGPVHELLPRYRTGPTFGDATSARTHQMAPPPLSKRKWKDESMNDSRLMARSTPHTLNNEFGKPVESHPNVAHSSQSPGHADMFRRYTEPSKAEPSTVEPNQILASQSVEEELLGIPSSHYTLQLMGGHDRVALKHFVEQHELQTETWVYSVSYQGRPWYMLIYGNYASAIQAHAAIQQVPEVLRKMGPWIKSFLEVKKEIKNGNVS
jgi:DamX protein